LAASFFDLNARGYIGGETARELFLGGSSAASGTEALFETLRERNAEEFAVVEPPRCERIDYMTLFTAEAERAHEAKKRARWRRE